MSGDKVKIQLVPLLSLLLGITGFLGVALLDRFYWQTGVFDDGQPDLFPGHLLRSLVILASLLLIFRGLLDNSHPRLVFSGGQHTGLVRTSTAGVLVLSVSFLLLFIISPSLFDSLSMEDGPIEWLSAILYFCCTLVMVLACLRCYGNRGVTAPVYRTLAMLSLVFFVLGMEEISWFQRVLGLETPGVFKANQQNEINLHNFYTKEMETIYYFGAFLLLVILPFVRVLKPAISDNAYLQIFIPYPYVSVPAAVACAYNYDMWNILFMQAAFYGALIVLLIFAALSKIRYEQCLMLFAALVVTITQAVFLIHGENLVRIWGATEYRELFIPLAFFVYALSVYGNLYHAGMRKQQLDRVRDKSG